MARLLDPPTRSALAARIQFYRDLGIYDFYRRDNASSPAGSPSVVPAAQENLREAVQIAAPSEANLFESTVAQPEHNLEDRAAALRVIREDLGECTRCRLHQGRTHLVFGVGNPRAELMLIGEAPGADEDQQGEPFVGRAGQLLNNMIKAMGLRRQDVYIANIVKCRPPGNRTPERDECETCSPFLMRQIAVIRPAVIVALGAVAAKTLLAINAPMSELRGRWYEFAPGYARPGRPGEPAWHGARLAVTYHPAFLLRDPRQKKEAWKDLQMVMQRLGLEPPAKSPA